MNRAPKWRMALGCLVLGLLGFFGIKLTPLYVHNFELQRFVSEAAHREGIADKSDDLLKTWVLERAADLNLPVKADNIHVRRAGNEVKIDVRYIVRVDLPLYTVDLHFYPGASSQ